MTRVTRLTGPVRSALLGRPTVAKRGSRVVLTATASLAAVGGTLAGCASSTEAADTAPAASATQVATAEASATEAATGSTSAASGTGEYTDGTYTAEGSYVSPSGEQSVEVTLTIEEDAVSDVEVVPQAVDPQSEGYQEKFVSGIEQEVVGVPIDELAVDKVAGSSLTSGGFNQALELIKAQAAA